MPGGSQGPGGSMVAPVHRHVARILEFKRLQRSIPQGWKRKGMPTAGSGSAWQGGQNLLFPAALKTAPPDGESNGNLRVKRPDPSFRANVPPTAAADPEKTGSDANADHSPACLDPVGRACHRQVATEPSREASLNNPARATAGTALLRGRKLRLPWRTASGSWQPTSGWCAQCQPLGKSAWRTPTPTFLKNPAVSTRGVFLFPEPR